MADERRAARKPAQREPGRSRRARRATTGSAVTGAGMPAGAARGRAVRQTVGWLIFGVGVVFVVLPVIPGIPVVMLAALLLAPDVPAFARLRGWSRSWLSDVTTGTAGYHERFLADFRRRFKS
jgi:uncharacterized membrane protein YdfJ with MMPL/SSD domain